MRAFVVWEPVIATDIAPPTTAKLRLVHDSRTIQYWDEGRALSKDIIRAVLANPSRYSKPAWVDEETIAWDLVLVFPKGVTWRNDVPVPSYYGGPVVEALSALRKSIAEQIAKPAE